MAEIAIVLNLPRKESARKPPSKHRRNEVPIKSVTILADAEVDRCIFPLKYVTRFTAIPIVESLSQNSIPVDRQNGVTCKHCKLWKLAKLS